MNNKIGKFLIIFCLLLTPLVSAQAADTKTGNSVYVAKGEIISGNLYVAGETVTVDGAVGGDLIAVAQTITVNGRVEGDIIAAAQDIVINGEVGGNVRIAGNSLTINGTVARNVNAFGAKVIFGSDSRIGWDIYLAGASAEIRGMIDGNVSGQAGQALITGKIGKNLNLKLNDKNGRQELTITSEAVINGDVTYTSEKLASISSQAKIAGQIKQEAAETKETNNFLLWLWKRLFSVFSALVVGLVLIFIGKNITTKILNQMAETPKKMIWPGLILMFVIPPLALVLIFTLIGIPLALMAAAWWITMTYVAKIFTAIFIGRLLLQRITKKKNESLLWALILGVIVCWLLFAIPYVGWIIGLVAIWFGLGGIWSYLIRELRD
jgi:cytoskeletal protein CcmA (bactofilin family)